MSKLKIYMHPYLIKLYLLNEKISSNSVLIFWNSTSLETNRFSYFLVKMKCEGAITHQSRPKSSRKIRTDLEIIMTMQQFSNCGMI